MFEKLILSTIAGYIIASLVFPHRGFGGAGGAGGGPGEPGQPGEGGGGGGPGGGAGGSPDWSRMTTGIEGGVNIGRFQPQGGGFDFDFDFAKAIYPGGRGGRGENEPGQPGADISVGGLFVPGGGGGASGAQGGAGGVGSDTGYPTSGGFPGGSGGNFPSRGFAFRLSIA